MEDREGKLEISVRDEDERVKKEDDFDGGDDDELNGEGRENSGKGDSVLAGLNLVLILSYVSLSAEECSNIDGFEERESAIRHDHKKVRNTNFAPKRNEANEFRSVERQSSKVNTKIKDCRHCRRF